MDSSRLTPGDTLPATSNQRHGSPARRRTDMCAHEYRGGGEQTKGRTTYPNSLIDQLAGLLQLLRGASDGEDAHVGVGVGWRVPLQLHVGARLLFDVLDGFPTWQQRK